MFGINLWARPFMHPASSVPGAPTLEGLSHLPRPPMGLGTPAYMIPGLTDNLKAGSLPMAPNSLFLYRPGEPLLHPSMLRLDHSGLGGHSTSPGGERSSLHANLHSDDDSYPSAFVPTKRARLEGYPGSMSDKSAEDHKSSSKSPIVDGRQGGSPLTEGRCPSTGGRSLNNGGLSPQSARSPNSMDATNSDERLSYTGQCFLH